MLFNLANIVAIERVSVCGINDEPKYAVYTTGREKPFYVGVEQGQNLEKMIQTMTIKEFM